MPSSSRAFWIREAGIIRVPAGTSKTGKREAFRAGRFGPLPEGWRACRAISDSTRPSRLPVACACARAASYTSSARVTVVLIAEMIHLLPRHLQQDAAGEVVVQGQEDQERQPEEAAERGERRQTGAVADVHEEEDDEERLGDGDRQGHDVVGPAEVDLGDPPGGEGEDQERGEDQKVHLAGGKVMVGHASNLRAQAAWAPSR